MVIFLGLRLTILGLFERGGGGRDGLGWWFGVCLGSLFFVFVLLFLRCLAVSVLRCVLGCFVLVVGSKCFFVILELVILAPRAGRVSVSASVVVSSTEVSST